MNINNKIKFDIAIQGNEELLKMNLDEFKSEASSYINLNMITRNSYKSPSYHYQP